jgi:cell wall-associated NlpC family hydrolase
MATATGVCLTVNAVADVAFRAGFRGEALVTAVAVSTAENGAHQVDLVHNNSKTAQNLIDAYVGRKEVITSRDRGLWQINDRAHPDVTDAMAFDPLKNAQAAYRISGGGTNFKPWVTYNSGAYKKFLTEARTAATGAATRAGGPSGQPTPTAPPTVAQPAPNITRIPVIVPYGGAHDSLPVDTVPIYPSDLSFAGEPGQGADAGAGTLASVKPRVTRISVDLALTEESEIQIDVADPELVAFNNGLLLPGLAVDLADLHFEVTAIEVAEGPAGELVTCTCRDTDAEFLKRLRDGVTGMHTGDAYLRAMTNGLEYVTEADAGKDVHYDVDKSDPQFRPQTVWSVADDWAKDIGYLFNVGQGTAFFGRPTFIAATMPGVVVKVAPGIQPPATHPDAPFLSLGVPSMRRLSDETDAGSGYNQPNRGLTSPVTGSVKLPQRRAARIRPGMRLELYGMASFDGSYIITRVAGDVDNDLTPWTISFETPQDPAPTDPAFAPAAPTSTPATTGAPAAGTKQATDFVAFAQAQAGKQYIYGAEANLNDPSPKAFDCSELVQWACARVGVAYPDGSGNQYAASKAAGLIIGVTTAANTRGALLFRGPGGSEHVAISLGDGKTTIEARGTAYGVVNGPISGRHWDGAALIPGLVYPKVAP